MANSASTPTLTNCTFNGNTAGAQGGGIMNSSVIVQTVENCIFWGNTDGDQSGTTETAQIHDESAGSTVTFSCIEGSWTGAGEFNIACDPSFTSTLQLQTQSPCIDTGNSCDVPVNIQTDLDGNSRILDGGGNTGQCPVESGTLLCTLLPRVDMGAFEFDPTPAALISHGSEKVHGSAGAFLIASGSVECRDIQGDMTLVYVFDKPVYSADGDAFVAGDFALTNGAFVSVTQSSDLKTLTVICNNVLDARCFAIAFTVENTSAVEVSFNHAWPILRGDADGDGLVDVDDTTEVNNQNGNPIDANNYRCDIDYDGLIEGSSTSPVGDDWTIANTAQGNGLLPCWPVSESISSRKSHGGRDYDIPTGGIEPRTGDLLIVFEFDRLVRSLDDDPLAPTDFTISSGTVAWVSAGWDWSTVEVTILGASDKETFTISFDAEDKDNFPVYTEGCWSMLVGDVDGDGSTSSVDTSAIAGANRAPITSSNFKYDIDANGQITGAAPDTTDYDLANANTGYSVPACP